MLVVVAGHLAMVVVDRGSDGSLRGDNLLALFPEWAWLGVLSPMPIFFATAGWSHARRTVLDTPGEALERVRVLALVSGAVALAWSVASLVALAVAGEGHIVPDGARLAIQPLWFLAAYVPLLLLAPRVNMAAGRPVIFVVAAAMVVGATDALRFLDERPRMVGAPGFLLVWAVPWVMGAWWRLEGPRDHRGEMRTGILLAGGAGLVCVLLVRHGGYSPSLIDAVPGRRTNSTPPTLFTLSAAVVQVGLLMLGASTLDRIADRFPRPVAGLGRVAVAVYAWHLTALVLCAAVLAAGMWTPDRFGPGWWWSRPAWWAAVVGLTLLFARATALIVPSAPRPPRSDVARWQALLAVTGLSTGAVLAGLYGPRSLVAASAIIVCFSLPMPWVGGITPRTGVGRTWPGASPGNTRRARRRGRP